MPLHDSLFLPTVTAGRASCHHRKVPLIGQFKHLEELVDVLDTVMMVRL